MMEMFSRPLLLFLLHHSKRGLVPNVLVFSRDLRSITYKCIMLLYNSIFDVTNDVVKIII